MKKMTLRHGERRDSLRRVTQEHNQMCVCHKREFENRARKIGMHFARGFSFD